MNIGLEYYGWPGTDFLFFPHLTLTHTMQTVRARLPTITPITIPATSPLLLKAKIPGTTTNQQIANINLSLLDLLILLSVVHVQLTRTGTRIILYMYRHSAAFNLVYTAKLIRPCEMGIFVHVNVTIQGTAMQVMMHSHVMCQYTVMRCINMNNDLASWNYTNKTKNYVVKIAKLHQLTQVARLQWICIKKPF